MSEEVTYADLKFQDSTRIENIQEFDQVGVKAPPSPSNVWHPRTLAVTLLCLLLLIGMGVLGTTYYLTSKIQMEKLKELQNFNDELQRNVSLQLTNNADSFKKIGNLSVTLKEMATKLCFELYRKKPEHKCKPCPKEWMWHENSCYVVHQEYENWQEGVTTCSTYNASLVTIKNKSTLKFIRSQRSYDFWLGLSPRKDDTYYEELDETIFSSDWFTKNTSALSGRMYCGYIRYTALYFSLCTQKKYTMCEKLADPVKIESSLMNEEPDG